MIAQHILLIHMQALVVQDTAQEQQIRAQASTPVLVQHILPHEVLVTEVLVTVVLVPGIAAAVPTTAQPHHHLPEARQQRMVTKRPLMLHDKEPAAI